MSALVDEYLTAATFKHSFRTAAAEVSDKGEAVAFAYPNDEEHTVYLCPPFWRRPATGPNSRAEVLAHELSHFDDVGPTEDHKYDLERCARLAKRRPDQALENAGSFAYYVGVTTLSESCFA